MKKRFFLALTGLAFLVGTAMTSIATPQTSEAGDGDTTICPPCPGGASVCCASTANKHV